MLFLRVKLYAPIAKSMIFYSTARQSKILSKLVGKQKKRKHYWQPDMESSGNTLGVPLPSSISKGTQGKKRVSVLNKLFMRNITDLMTTGPHSELIKGLGLEITKVKVTQDFQIVNVYWSYFGDHNKDALESILKKTAGHLRKELSSLRLMGHIPNVNFVKDKGAASSATVDALLNTLDLKDYNEEDNLEDLNTIPPMRQDVFGLDREAVLKRIQSSMKSTSVLFRKKSYNKDLATLQVMDQAVFTDFLKKQKIARNKMMEKERFDERNIMLSLNSEETDEHGINEEVEEEDYVADDEYYK